MHSIQNSKMDAANITDQKTALLWRGMHCDPHIDALIFEFTLVVFQ